MTCDDEVAFDQQTEVVTRAEALGINVSEHLCGCAACAHTTVLCPATLSSLELAIDALSALRDEGKRDDT
jgi:hypothetical protein